MSYGQYLGVLLVCFYQVALVCELLLCNNFWFVKNIWYGCYCAWFEIFPVWFFKLNTLFFVYDICERNF